MNIFVLSENPQRAAQYHCDKHVVKMVLETAQLLSSCHHVMGNVKKIGDRPHVGNTHIYLLTHRNHPCAVWTRESTGNYLWLAELFRELLKEYTRRYGKIHACQVMVPAFDWIPSGITRGPRTEFVKVMPAEYIQDDPVESYRRYYREGKRDLLMYKFTDRPEFLNV